MVLFVSHYYIADCLLDPDSCHYHFTQLQIDWDDSSPLSLELSRFVNAWQVQLVAYPPLPSSVRICDPIAPLCPGDVSYPLIGPESQAMAMILGSPIPAGMQGARHTGPPSESSAMLTTRLLFPLPNRDLQMPPRTSPSASSEILDPEAASPPNNSVSMRPAELPVQVKSIQLFGATITPHVVQSATDGVSEQVIGAPNGDAMADDNVGKDV